VLTALVVGLVASSALVIGALAGAFFKPPRRLIAVALAFASGALIISLTFERTISLANDQGALRPQGGLGRDTLKGASSRAVVLPVRQGLASGCS
jgi:zinc transporter, ZIP family